MIKRINNFSDYGIPTCSEPLFAYLLDDSNAISDLQGIIRSGLNHQGMVLKASGMLDNILIAKKYNGDLIYFDEGDASKIFIKKFPELLMSFPNISLLDQIVDDWVCTCYERRILYFVDSKNLPLLIDLLLECKFNVSTCFEKIWPLVNLVIENLPEAPNHNTFVLMAKRDLISHTHKF